MFVSALILSSLLGNIVISIEGVLTAPTSLASNKGFAICAGDRMVSYLEQTLMQLRIVWRSQLPIYIVHCSEISSGNMNTLNAYNFSINVIDICFNKTQSIFGMPIRYATKKLRGFFCKVAAVLTVPFNEVMLLDMDTVWLRNPELLFQTSQYKETGSLFFRSRLFRCSARRNHFESIMKVFLAGGMDYRNMTIAEANDMALANGFSVFWHHALKRVWNTGEYPCFTDFQDSSCVLLNRAKRPKTFQVMEKLLPSFATGYGDKELFWTSATISGEKFAWEPFHASQYADCYGVQLHFDPSDAPIFSSMPVEKQSQIRLLPLYLNAEYLVEADTTFVGQFVSDVMTPPLLAFPPSSTRPRQINSPAPLNSSTESARRNAGKSAVPPDQIDFNTWPMGGGRGLRGCTCSVKPCVTVRDEMRRRLLVVQWLALSTSLKGRLRNRRRRTASCISVSTNTTLLALLNRGLQDIVDTHGESICVHLGCPKLPILIGGTGNRSDGAIVSKDATVCVLVSF